MASSEISLSGSLAKARTIVLTDGTSHTSPITNAVASDYVDVIDFKRGLSILCENGASETATFTVETSIDGSSWATLAFGDMTPASGAAVPQYGVAARTLAASAKTTLKLPLGDVQRYLRVNVSDSNGANGTAFTVLAKP